MPRYLVHRTFPDGLLIPTDRGGAETTAAVVRHNAEHDVTWLHSYVTPDKHTTFCVYDGPDSDAIRTASTRSQQGHRTPTRLSQAGTSVSSHGHHQHPAAADRTGPRST